MLPNTLRQQMMCSWAYFKHASPQAASEDFMIIQTGLKKDSSTINFNNYHYENYCQVVIYLFNWAGAKRKHALNMMTHSLQRFN